MKLISVFVVFASIFGLSLGSHAAADECERFLVRTYIPIRSTINGQPPADGIWYQTKSDLPAGVLLNFAAPENEVLKITNNLGLEVRVGENTYKSGSRNGVTTVVHALSYSAAQQRYLVTVDSDEKTQLLINADLTSGKTMVWKRQTVSRTWSEWALAGSYAEALTTADQIRQKLIEAVAARPEIEDTLLQAGVTDLVSLGAQAAAPIDMVAVHVELAAMTSFTARLDALLTLANAQLGRRKNMKPYLESLLDKAKIARI